MPATYQTDGAFAAVQPGNDTGAACTGIGVGSNRSGVGVPGNFTAAAVDFAVAHIGNGTVASADSNSGQLITGATFVAGTGYTNGSYDLPTVGGGAGAIQGVITVTVAGGLITAAVVKDEGGKFSSTPTVALVGMGAGTGGSVTLTSGLTSPAYALGAAYGNSKATQYLTAIGAVANNAAISPSTYLNRSGRAMVAGESAWGVAP